MTTKIKSFFQKKANRGIAIMLSMAMVFTMIPTFSIHVSAQGSAGSVGPINAGVDSILTEGTGVYLGNYDHAASFTGIHGVIGKAEKEGFARPILWNIMGTEASGTKTLLSTYVLDSKQFNATDNNYAGSDIQRFLAGDFLNSFSNIENKAIPTTDVITGKYDVSNGNEIIGSPYPTTTFAQKVYLPWGNNYDKCKMYWTAGNDKSKGEYVATKTGTLRGSGSYSVYYWLRSPYNNSIFGVADNGWIVPNTIGMWLGIRPACQLNMSSIIMARPVETSNYKLTMLGGNNGADVGTLSGVKTTEIIVKDNTSPCVTGLSATGPGDTIGYKLVSAGGKILSSGTVAKSSTSFQIDTRAMSFGDSATAYVWLEKTNSTQSNEGTMPQSFTVRKVQPPSITTQPVANTSLKPGENLSLSVTASNATSYQWYKGNNSIAGATTAIYTKNGVTSDDAGNYYCKVTGLTGDALSNVAKVTVQKYSPSLSLSVSDSSPQTYPKSIILTGTLSGAYIPNGKIITFKDGNTTLGTGTIDENGVASYTYIPSSGKYSYNAGFAGDANNNSATSPLLDYTIGKGIQTTPIIGNKPASNTVTYGDNAFTLSANGSESGGVYSWRSSDSTVISVDPSIGKVTILKAGSATIYVKKSGDANYNDSAEASVDITVAKKEITISGITASSKTYDGTTNANLNMPSITTAMGLVSGDNLNVTATGTFVDNNVANGKTVNIASIILGGASAGNYQLASTGQQTTATANITAKALATSDVNITLGKDSYIFTNSEIKPEPTVTIGTTTLVKDRDYTLSYTNNTNLGTASIKIEFKGNYSGLLCQDFDITYGTAPEGSYTITSANSNGWYNSDFAITAGSGYTVSTTPTTGFGNSTTINTESVTDGTSYTVYLKNSIGEIFEKNITYKLDKTKPTDVTLSYGGKSFKEFLNIITFDLFFKDTVTVTLIATDPTSGVKEFSYKLGDGSVKTIAATNGAASFTVEPQFKGNISEVKAIDNAGNQSVVKAYEYFSVGKNVATTPTAPGVKNKTHTSVTLVANASYEYSMDNGATWQDSEVFTGLKASTEYTFVARVKETSTTFESLPSAGTAITTEKTPMTGTIKITGDTKFGQTLTASQNLTNGGTVTYQWNRNGVPISGATGSNYILKEDDIGKSITVTVTADGSVGTGSITSSGTGTIAKADGPSALAAPGVANKTHTSVTLDVNANDLYEYSKDNGATWQDSGVFTGLTASTEYTFIARVKATSTTKESVASAGTKITTDATPMPPTSKPDQTTVKGDVIDKNGESVKGLEAQVSTETNGNKTVEVKSKDAILLKQPDGTKAPLTDVSKLKLEVKDNTKVSIAADGTIQVKDLAKGTETKISVTYDLGNGQKICMGTMDVKVDSNGNVSLTSTLVDPYGTITDAATGKVIEGSDVKLYYANTDRNKANGKTPDTLVALPIIDGFKPNNNKNPQVSDTNGAYGFMVFPTADYYIVATKDGYNEFKSPTISVEQDIVKLDFKMNKPSTGLDRLSGLNRVDTAIEIAKKSYTGKLSNVILATADGYSDALAGSVLAYKLNAPILLVGSSAADQEKVITYIKANMDGAGTVYILGGTGVVTSTFEANVLASGFKNITRLGGANRYETSLKIANKLDTKVGTPVVLAYGEDYPDALSISSTAAVMQYPILLVQKDGMSDAVKQKLAEIKPTKVYIIGLQGVINASVEDQVIQATALTKGNIVRIGGQDRYETSLAVAKYFGLNGQNVCIATGNNYPDALAGSVYAANTNSPIILANGSLSDNAVNYLKTRKIIGATIFGGEAVISKEVEKKISELIVK